MGIRWGVLATGGIASAFAEDLAVAGLDLVAVGSRSSESAERFAARHGIDAAHAHASYEALAADPEVDIVYIATPHPGHAPAALTMLEAGKHVLVEKPFTMNADEARQIVELAERQGLLVLEAMWTRFLPHMLRLHEIIDAGTIGEVRAVIADHHQDLPRDPSHRINDPRLGGGALLDLGVYPVSFAIDVLSAPTEVKALASFTATGVDAQTSMVFAHEGGAQSLLTTALDLNGPNTATVIGTAGRIEIEDTWYTPTDFTVRGGKGEVLERYESSVEGRGMQYQALEAERLLAAGETASPRLSPQDSVLVMDTLDRVRAEIGLEYGSSGQ